ncbi:hypothetical protein CXB51_008990 [Gossypium anomalum]|uniref:DUF4218 domain-containing protein n=1 Tax=Gossypium anomalum TaxID=47600 RepID=A0A8J5YZ12_9ROSI|nr:hypothetical protein CXB51_008990 [Gossypium anomalum]
MVIPGEKGPGNDIDVYMQPLIKELMELWAGVDAFDSSASESFTLRACLLWTINDFLANANFSGWSTKGRVACPVCAEKIESRWLRYGRKFCSIGHHRWLLAEHPFQKQSREFDGTIEHGVALIPRSGEDILREVEDEGCDLFNNFKELAVEGDEANIINQDKTLWKKMSIFFDLPYWCYNLLRHNLDIIHIKKNVCDNVVGTFLNLSRDDKDNIKACKDLQDMGIRSYLHPKMRNEKEYLQQACYTASKETYIFLSIVKNLKVPDGYASNISRCVNLKEHKLSNLKSHDGHILMQVLLPICLRGVVEKKKIFPPSFFTIMIHLIIHLPIEAKLGGPVQYMWMYPIERYLMGLKASVCNRAYPEGSIVEGYIVSECLTFCSRYVFDVETIFSRPPRNDGNIQKRYIFSSGGRLIGTMNTKILDMRSLAQANRYVLLHSNKLSPYRQRSIHSGFSSETSIYVKDGKSEGWLHVIRIKPRDLFNLSVETPVEDDEYPQCDHHIVTLNGFQSGKFMTLVATNVAARGLDINDMQLIIQEVENSYFSLFFLLLKTHDLFGALLGLDTLGSADTDSQSTGDETPTQSKEEVPTTLAGTSIAFSLIISLEKFDLEGKVEDSGILSHVGKLQKEFKSTLKTRYYNKMVQKGRPIEEIYENNPPGVHDDQWKWLVERWGTLQAAAQSEKAKESRTKVRYAHTAGSTGYATLNAQFAEKEGREPSHLEQFRFQHLWKDGSDKLSSEAAEQDEACKMDKDSMPTPESSFAPQDNIALENEVYTQVFGPEKDGKTLGYGCGMTKSRLFGYGSVTRGSQSISAISTLIEEISVKHVEQIQTIQAE